MKALVNTAPGRLEWLDWRDPQPGWGQVRIRTLAVGICATDLEMIRGWERTACPSIPGHEWFGCVDGVGAGVDAGLLGAVCVAENILEDGGEVGFEHPGAYGQYFLTLASNLHLLPSGFPARRGILVEPLAVGVRCLNRLRLEDLRNALVLGDGPVGLLLLLLLRQAGVEKIVMVGGRAGRLRLAQELGASAVFNFRTGGLAQELNRIAAGGFSNVVEVSGSGESARAALELAARGGHVVLLGDYASQIANFPWNLILHHEIVLAGSNASAGGWDEAVRLAAGDGLLGSSLERLVSHTFPIQEHRAAFELVQDGGENVVKVMLTWP